MSPAAVVEALNERENLGTKLLLVRAGASVDQLFFECRKEGLGDRVFVGVPPMSLQDG